ncbi:MAG: MFS transporter [Chloroflexi bacterium]|nr:MFS transporter [Chloroflexota bacterium]
MAKVFARPRVFSRPAVKAQTQTEAQRKRGLFYGWWIVIAASVSQAYTSGTFWQGFGAFFDPIVAQFGWSRAITSASVSIQRTESGAISPFVGWFTDKFGPRKVMIAGLIVTGLGFILLSRINSLWQFYAAFIIITLGLSFGTFLVATTTVANWFVALRSRAMAITFAGSALGGLLVPLVVWIIAISNWRTGLMVIGIGFWVVCIPLAFVMRSRPEDYGMLPDGRQPEDEGAQAEGAASAGQPKRSALKSVEADFSTREALKTRTFWQLAMAMGAGQLIISASIHQIPAMTSYGISATTAGIVIMFVSLLSMVGRLSSGFLGDVMDKRRVIAIAFSLQLIGTLIFASATDAWHLIGFIVFWGIGFGASIPVRFALIADMFGRHHFGSIMGIMMTVSTIFGVVGPVFVGWMFDVRGNYREPYFIMAATMLVAIPLILTLTSPVQERARAATLTKS